MRTHGYANLQTTVGREATRIEDYFLDSVFAPFFLSAFGFIPFLSFFWLLLPFPMIFPFALRDKLERNDHASFHDIANRGEGEKSEMARQFSSMRRAINSR